MLVFFFFFFFSSSLSIANTSLGEDRANVRIFVSLFDLRLFGFVCFLFLLVSELGYGL